MTSLTAEQFAKELAPLLKQQGFGKQRLQWRQDLGTTLAVLNVRVSAWGDRRDDVNVDIYLKALGVEQAASRNWCQDLQCLAGSSPPEVAVQALAGFAGRRLIHIHIARSLFHRNSRSATGSAL
ncbi:hypothetical protein [Roseateles sp.]|uniref:hypothetical protein n=1 Tax=Roseateles sp. TaxID=1971397 RepID=UPI002EDB929F